MSRRGLEIVMCIDNLQVTVVEHLHLEDIARYMREYLLLPRDALHVPAMSSIGCKDIASAAKILTTYPPSLDGLQSSHIVN